jgi:hypothetical protein
MDFKPEMKSIDKFQYCLPIRVFPRARDHVVARIAVTTRLFATRDARRGATPEAKEARDGRR